MAQDQKQDIFFYGGQNSDDMLESLPSTQGDYILGVNICNTSKSEDNTDGKITARKGNTEIYNPFLVDRVPFIENVDIPLIERKVVGSIKDEASNKLYYYVYEYYGQDGVGFDRYRSIYEYDNDTKRIEAQVVRTQLAIFDETKNVKWGFVLYGNLFWVQDGIEPKSVNIEKLKNYTLNTDLTPGVDTFNYPAYRSLSLREFNLIKAPPTKPIEVQYGNDSNVITNNVREKLFQFRYKYIYRDGTESVWSPISFMPKPFGEINADGSWNNAIDYNFIRLSYEVNTIEVKSVQIAKREYDGDKDEPSSFEIVHTEFFSENLDDSLGDTTFDRFYKFYNDIKGITVSDFESSKQLEHIPLSASTIEVISNPDKIVVGGDVVEPTSRLNIETDVVVSVVKEEVENMTSNDSDTSETYNDSNIRNTLHPYWIENINVFGRKRFHFNFSGACTAIYIPENYSGESVKITLSHNPTNDPNAVITKVFNISISGISGRSNIRDSIVNAINAEMGSTFAYNNRTNFETDISPAGSFFDPVAANKWRYLDWAFGIQDIDHPFQGYKVGAYDVTDLDNYVVFIKTGAVLEASSGYSFSNIEIETDETITDTTTNRNRLRAAGDLSGIYLLNQTSAPNVTMYSALWLLSMQEYYGQGVLAMRKIEESEEHLSERGTIESVLETIVDQSDIENNSNLQVVQTHAPFGEYGTGIVYFDNNLRPGYVQKSDNAYIKRLDSDFGEALRYKIKMDIKHLAPDWAAYWMPVITKNKKMARFFEVDVSIDPAPSTVVQISGDFIQIRVNESINLWNNQFGNTLDSLPEYVWAKGDRIILYNLTTKEYIDKEIIKQETDYIYVSRGTSFSAASDVDLLVKIYTPRFTTETDFYYEVGEINPVLQPFGRHVNSKTNTNQLYPANNLEYIIDFGDIYLNTINNYKAANTGTIWQPTYNEFYRAFYPSKFNSFGRTHIAKENLIPPVVKDRIRISNATIDNAIIKGWNKFDFEDLEDMGDSYGKVVALVRMGYTLKVITELKNISIYVNRTAPVNPDGSESLILTDRTIGAISIPQYNHGCKHPNAIIKHNRDLYYPNLDNGMIIRDSANGQFPINSYKYNTYFDKLKKFVQEDDDNILMFGTFNKDENEYILITNNNDSEFSLPISNDLTAAVFNESLKRWTGHITLRDDDEKAPEWSDYLNSSMFTFLNGRLYLENTENADRASYYNRQFVPYIDTIVNFAPKKIKTFQGIAIHATDKWDLREAGDIYIYPTTTYPNGMSSRLKPNKLRDKEGVFYSQFMGDGLSRETYIEGIINGRELRGAFMKLRLRNSLVNSDSQLFSVSVRFNPSEHSY